MICDSEAPAETPGGFSLRRGAGRRTSSHMPADSASHVIPAA